MKELWGLIWCTLWANLPLFSLKGTMKVLVWHTLWFYILIAEHKVKIIFVINKNHINLRLLAP